MKEHMLPNLRKEVGLGSPPEPYYQNKSECMNEVIKDQVKYQENELPEFIDKLSCIAERHRDLLRKAVARTGEWELIPGFRYLERADWYQMTPHQREAHMQVVMNVELIEDRSTSAQLLPQPSSTMPLLSMGYDDIPSISTFTLKKIWKEAREIVGSLGYILPVAGSSCPFAKQVYNSKQPSKPLVVTVHAKKNVKGHIFQCDPGCTQYAYLKMCCHTVATAEANHVLKEYIEFLKANVEMPNLHQLSVKGARSGAGRKGGKPARQRAHAGKKQPVLTTSFTDTVRSSRQDMQAGNNEREQYQTASPITRDGGQRTSSPSSLVPYDASYPAGPASLSSHGQQQSLMGSSPIFNAGFPSTGSASSQRSYAAGSPAIAPRLLSGHEDHYPLPGSSLISYAGSPPIAPHSLTGQEDHHPLPGSSLISYAGPPSLTGHEDQYPLPGCSLIPFAESPPTAPASFGGQSVLPPTSPTTLGGFPPGAPAPVGSDHTHPMYSGNFSFWAADRSVSAVAARHPPNDPVSIWQSKPPFPSPSVGVFNIYLLQFCPSQVAKCFGCQQALKPGGHIPQIPSNIVIVTKMRREYTSPSNGEKVSKVSNVYFHCCVDCVKRKQPHFVPAQSIIPESIIPHLLPLHVEYLKAVLGMNVGGC